MLIMNIGVIVIIVFAIFFNLLTVFDMFRKDRIRYWTIGDWVFLFLAGFTCFFGAVLINCLIHDVITRL